MRDWPELIEAMASVQSMPRSGTGLRMSLGVGRGAVANAVAHEIQKIGLSPGHGYEHHDRLLPV